MAYPRTMRGWRPILVDDVRYFWCVRDRMLRVLGPVSGCEPLLINASAYPEQELPGMVARVVRTALTAGWDPLQKFPPRSYDLLQNGTIRPA